MSNKELIERGREFARSTNLGGGRHLVSALCDALESVPEPQGEPSGAQVLAALNAYNGRNPGRTLSDWSEGSVQGMRDALRAANEVRS